MQRSLVSAGGGEGRWSILGGSEAQADGLGPKVGGRLALFYIHQMH